MSKTRAAFIEAKKSKKQQRADDAYLKAHTFWCKGERRRNGNLRECQFEVRFREAALGVTATCSFCQTVHVYATRELPGVMKEGWLTQADYMEIFIPDESLLRLDDVYREIDTEKNVKDEKGYMKQVAETIIVADHAPWCGSPDVPIIGLSAKLGGPGRIRWRDRKGIIRHNCVSSEAGRKHGVISAQVRRTR